MPAKKVSPALEQVKMILWLVIGGWAVVTGARLINGIGASSGLSDVTPWGFWIAMVESGVAFAAGGFVVAAVVYIFGLEHYHDFARRAIMIALLGYLTAATGLFFELGLPWNVWHPMVYWQYHSVLFEVGMCVMCYLTVLSLEFSPAVLEHPLFQHRFFQTLMVWIKKATIPLVIAGIMLSTLHQSSLGSLFLIQPYRVHALWYSPILPILFYVSAIGLGLMVVTLESLLSGWLFGHKIHVDKLAGLGRIASFVLALYLLLRVGDLWHRGVLPQKLDGSFESGLFMVELLFSAVLPAILLAIKRVRTSIPGLATCATLTFLGVVGYRFNICYVAFYRPADMPYFPTWTEVMVTAGVVAGAITLFIFFNENLKIVDDHHDAHDHAPAPKPAERPALFAPSMAWFTSTARRATWKHSLAGIIAASLAFGLLPEGAVFGPKPMDVPTHSARTLEALAVAAPEPEKREFYLASLGGNVPASANPAPVTLKIIDGNQNWRFVPFAHDDHIALLGDRESCRKCHHQNATFDTNTSCAHCHRDMYKTTDTFVHSLHVRKLGGNAACATCHPRDVARKSRDNRPRLLEMPRRHGRHRQYRETRRRRPQGQGPRIHGSHARTLRRLPPQNGRRSARQIRPFRPLRRLPPRISRRRTQNDGAVRAHARRPPPDRLARLERARRSGRKTRPESAREAGRKTRGEVAALGGGAAVAPALVRDRD